MLTATFGALMGQYEPAPTHPRPWAGRWMMDDGGTQMVWRKMGKPFSVVLREGKQVQKRQWTWDEGMLFFLPRGIPSDLRPQSKRLLVLQETSSSSVPKLVSVSSFRTYS